jgi:hypothetical protein
MSCGRVHRISFGEFDVNAGAAGVLCGLNSEVPGRSIVDRRHDDTAVATRITRVKFDSPDDVYRRALPDGHEFDPFDEQSQREHSAALDEVARVHPLKSWPNRCGGYSNEDVDRCMELLRREFGHDQYIGIAKLNLLTKKQVADWKYRRNRHRESQNGRTGRFRQGKVQEGEHPTDAAKALLYRPDPVVDWPD